MKNLKYLIMILLLTGCTQTMQRGCKHTTSDWIGLNRKIILYSSDGTIIKEWDTRAKVEIVGSTVQFLNNGKDVKLMGTVLIEEK